jgi:hypothetical protein
METQEILLEHNRLRGRSTPKGYSHWLLGRRDRRSWSYPSDLTLKRLFRNAGGSKALKTKPDRRGTITHILYLPVGTRKSVRDRFIALIAQHHHTVLMPQIG